MIAVLFSARHPPLGVALLGLLIAVLDGTLHLLPYIVFCSMIALSFWVPSSHSIETEAFNMSADLRILIFLLALPVSSIGENILFRSARHLFLETVVCWFEMRYVQPAHATGIWPDTWSPIMNAFRSCEFVAGFLDGVMGEDSDLNSAHVKGVPAEDNQASKSDSRLSRCEGLRTCPAEKKPSSSLRTAQNKGRRKRGHKHNVRFEPVGRESSLDVRPSRKTFISCPRVSPLSPWATNDSGVLSPVTKNLSRVAGLLFHHRTPRKPIITRHHFNFKATAHPARTPTNLGFYFSYHSRLWARSEDQDTRVSDNASFCDPVQPVECVSEGLQPTFKPSRYLPWTHEASAINVIPPDQQQCRQPSHMPQVPESTIRTTQLPFLSTSTGLDVPEQVMADPQPALPAQDQYAQGVSQSRSLDDAPMSESSVSSYPCIPPMLDGPLHGQLLTLKMLPHQPRCPSHNLFPNRWCPVGDGSVSTRSRNNIDPRYAIVGYESCLAVGYCRAYTYTALRPEHILIIDVVSPITCPTTRVIPQTFTPPEAPAVATRCNTRTATSGIGAAADTEMVANDDDESSSDSEYHPNSDADMDSESSSDTDSDSCDEDDEDDEGTATDTGDIYAQSSVVRTYPSKNKVPNPLSGQNASSSTSRDPSSSRPKDVKGKGKPRILTNTWTTSRRCQTSQNSLTIIFQF
ncbi:hypothetical protein BGW80DRAFT_1455779 [Lactifluus volemus]|nr:hypothetical protein BGW80DRAFT_1455779 [Lactifluus volemus]